MVPARGSLPASRGSRRPEDDLDPPRPAIAPDRDARLAVDDGRRCTIDGHRPHDLGAAARVRDDDLVLAGLRHAETDREPGPRVRDARRDDERVAAGEADAENRLDRDAVHPRRRAGVPGPPAAADVRWNAAVALARHGSHEGVPVLRQMLDRTYVEQTVKRDVRQDEDQDPIADVMISGLRAAAALKDPTLRASVEGLSHQDRSMKVRQAALEALKAMG